MEGLYVNKISSLEEKALAQVAINLCQDMRFKEVALRLEKPTYGFFFSIHSSSYFVSDPEKLSVWTKVKEEERLRYNFMDFCDLNKTKKVRHWDAAIDEQCQRLMEGIHLPDRLRHKIHPWINRVALQYLSYSQKQEVFGISRYFLMDIFTREDWKENARLDEKKLAHRLLEDERFTVLERYRIACVYCLQEHISQLWERLTQDEKRSVDCERGVFNKNNPSVLLWSHYMNANRKRKIASRERYLLSAAAQAISYGNRAALMSCWKEFPEDIQQRMVIDWALKSLRRWIGLGKESESDMIKFVVGYELADFIPDNIEKRFILPSCYSDLMFFFLSQMDQDQLLTFFKKVFQSEYCYQSEYYKSFLECFLDWPHQEDFLPTVNQLWGIIPKDKFGQCLLTLASKYNRNDEKANDYDYRSLLEALWEVTPKEYKQYVFRYRNIDYSVTNVGKRLLCRLLERSPFQEKDEALFKRIFRDQPHDKRRVMIILKKGKYAKSGEKMCSLLMQKEKLSFLNGLLEECLSKDEIPDFKKRFIRSDCGVKLCLDILKESREKLVEDILDWGFDSDAEKTQWKNVVISSNACLYACSSLLCKGKFADVERVILFFLSSDEKKERFKARLAQRACDVLLEKYTRNSLFEDCVWEKLDAVIAWRFDTQEKIRDFKKDLFSRKSIDIHSKLVGISPHPFYYEGTWGKAERFYRWFGLSPEEIKQLKRNTAFSTRIIYDIGKMLGTRDWPLDYTELVAMFRWCLTDEEMVIDLRKKIEKYLKKRKLMNFKKGYQFKKEVERLKKKQLGHFIGELFDGFKNEVVQDRISREGFFLNDRGEKRSCVAVDDECTSPRKRCKEV